MSRYALNINELVHLWRGRCLHSATASFVRPRTSSRSTAMIGPTEEVRVVSTVSLSKTSRSCSYSSAGRLFCTALGDSNSSLEAAADMNIPVCSEASCVRSRELGV